jgi:hypothetical protein
VNPRGARAEPEAIASPYPPSRGPAFSMGVYSSYLCPAVRWSRLIPAVDPAGIRPESVPWTRPESGRNLCCGPGRNPWRERRLRRSVERASWRGRRLLSAEERASLTLHGGESVVNDALLGFEGVLYVAATRIDPCYTGPYPHFLARAERRRERAGHGDT